MKLFFPETLRAYAEKHTAPESAALKSLARETRARTAKPHMMAGPSQGAFLRLLVRMSRAKRVLEIGTFTGYSALAMAEGLPKGGRVTTLDVDAQTTRIARRHWAKSRHGSKIRLILGPALESLKKLRGSFDFVYIDADKRLYIDYWEACVPRLRKGGVIAADNTLYSGKVLDPEEPNARALTAFNRHVKKEKRVDPVLLPLRDGLTVAVRL